MSLSCLSADYWQLEVLLADSAPGVKPLVRLLGFGGVVRVGGASAREAGSIMEQLFCGGRGLTSLVLGMTDTCRCPSARSGGLVGAGPVVLTSELGGLGVEGGEGLRALWSADFDSSSCGDC